MRAFFLLLSVVSLLGLTSCDKPNDTGNLEITRIVINKGDRKMLMMHEDIVLARYDIDLGFTPVGHKQFQGDGRTPEGRYRITRRNPQSLFHLSLGISYPNAEDRRRAAALGRSPGGDIFIHGAPRPMDPQGRDWTAGCISVSDAEIEEIYPRVKIGTIVDIYP